MASQVKEKLGADAGHSAASTSSSTSLLSDFSMEAAVEKTRIGMDALDFLAPVGDADSSSKSAMTRGSQVQTTPLVSAVKIKLEDCSLSLSDFENLPTSVVESSVPALVQSNQTTVSTSAGINVVEDAAPSKNKSSTCVSNSANAPAHHSGGTDSPTATAISPTHSSASLTPASLQLKCCCWHCYKLYNKEVGYYDDASQKVCLDAV
jgi:hypothetical protein